MISPNQIGAYIRNNADISKTAPSKTLAAYIVDLPDNIPATAWIHNRTWNMVTECKGDNRGSYLTSKIHIYG